MTTTLIERYLQSIDQATFQKLMNHLLYLEGYKFIGSPGAVIGKNKTSQGSPDSFFVEGESYVFCEFTTQEKLPVGSSFIKKLKADIDHCFDTSITKIEGTKVSKIILGFTSDVSPQEYRELFEQSQKYNPSTRLQLYSIQEIPFKLLSYPGLPEKYVPGIKTTTSSFYTLPDFLITTTKGLQPSLTNPFSGRENETIEAKQLLIAKDILVISGGQGVGKSKLAVQLSEIFENDYGFEPRVIVGSPAPLWEDLQQFISPSKKYLIFFDDANKSLPNLDYLLQFIQSRETGSTKIIITVRDYVRDELNKFLLNTPYSEMAISPFNDEQLTDVIKQFMPADLRLEQVVLDKILLLAKGNSRLSLMAVSAILQNNDVVILNNVFSLYEQYFQKIATELSFLNKPANLKALGILSFFNVLDRNNLEVKAILEDQFSIGWNELWEIFLELDKAELVQVFHGVAKISDQVLSTYVFYKTFFDENTVLIKYSDWLVTFLNKYPKKVRKSFVDLVNTFGHKSLESRVAVIISPARKAITDPSILHKFYEIFWFCQMTETLSFVRSWILSLENEPTQVNEIAYSYGLNDYVQASDYLNLLKDFWQHETPYFKDAVKLGLTIIFKQPSKTPEILRHLTEGIIYQRYDFQYNYIRQFTFLDIIERADYSERERIIVDQVFLAISPNLLKWEFTEPEGKGEGKMVIHRFVLRKTKALLNIRRIILDKVTKLYIGNEDKVVEIIRQYFWTSRVFDSTIFAEEEIVIGDFLMKNFKPEIYSHCEIIHDYVETLVEYGITPKYDWMPFLTSETMNLAKIFNPKLDQEGLKFEEREAIQRERVADFVRGKNLVFIEATLSRLDSIYSSAIHNKETYWIDSSLTYLFQFLASEDSTLYYGALELLMRRKYSFELPYGNIIFRPIREKWIAPKDVYERLNRYEFKQKQFWKQMVFDALEPEDIDQYFLLEFIGFLFSVTDRFCFWDTDKYLKFDSQFKLSKHLLPSSASGHQNILTFITEILIEKAKQYDISFDHHVCETCYTYFIDHVHLLKKVYFLNHKRGSYYDHEGKEMAAISLLDSNVLIEYLNMIPVESPLDFKFDNVSLAFVWQMPDYERLVNEAIEVILEKVPYLGGFEYEANQLFKNLKPDVITEKVYPYISRFIITHSSSELHLDMIMNVVLHTFENETLRFIKEILLANKDVEFAKGIRFEKGGLYSGSRVPRLEASINFYKSLIALVQSFPNPLDYAGHIGHWNEEIQWNENAKITEMKNDFKGWYD